MPLMTPMRLLRIPEPFDHPDFLFEPKLDGFRALAHIRGHHCELVSRNGHTFKQWPQLCGELAHAVRTRSAVLDGEVCCLTPDGRSNFKQLLYRREWPHFYAFDVLSIDGEDLTALPLLERKRRLRGIMPTIDTRLLYLDHLERRGCDCSGWRASGISKASSPSGARARIASTAGLRAG
jgi:bifunctional non-homologous end joining protein LigD